MRILLVGGTEQVGQELCGLPLPAGVELVRPTRDQLDLLNARSITDMLAAGPWSAVINAAAYTDVDRAESEEALAYAVNAEGPARLANETARFGIPLIHLSTNYVFDGRKGMPYHEDDPVGPLNAYGRSKLAGEQAVQGANSQHIILRTSWIYSPYRMNFVKTILRLARERDHLEVVNDQRGCPTSARDIAATCLALATRCSNAPAEVSYGLFHFAGDGDATWFDLAAATIVLAGNRLMPRPRCSNHDSQYKTPARRPADTRLSHSRLSHSYGIKPQHWRQALKQTIEILLAPEGAR